MQYSFVDRFKMFALQHRKGTVIFFTCLLIGVILNLVRVSYSERMAIENNSFDEIQSLIVQIKEKDRDAYNKYNAVKIEKETKGIDISSWQGDINWEKVKNSDIDFVMIRCGLRGLTSDNILEDSKFRYNIEQANKYDIPVGIYFFSTAINEIEVLEEASFVLNLIKDYKITYPVAYDFETFHKNRAEGVSDLKINKNALKFLDYIRGHGYYAILYGNQGTLNKNWNTSYLKDYDVWLAQYIDTATYDGKYSMWQYSDHGRVDGIAGYVDLDISYYDYVIK